MSSSFCSFCTHACTLVCPLAFGAPGGGRVCETPGVTGNPLILFLAGGTTIADETGANKDAHQAPVIQLETSNCVPAVLPEKFFLGPLVTRTS